MAALVLKEWRASSQPVDSAGNYVLIQGRQAGLVAWLLARLGVDPTTTVRVDARHVEFARASLAGTDFRMIRLGGICSTYYGYNKPWTAALGLFFFLLWLSSSVSLALAQGGGGRALGVLVAFAVSAGLSLLYYYLSRTLTLGFVEQSGMVSGLQFKRSVVEGVDVNEQQARYICDITQFLIEASDREAAR